MGAGGWGMDGERTRISLSSLHPSFILPIYEQFTDVYHHIEYSHVKIFSLINQMFHISFSFLCRKTAHSYTLLKIWTNLTFWAFGALQPTEYVLQDFNNVPFSIGWLPPSLPFSPDTFLKWSQNFLCIIPWFLIYAFFYLFQTRKTHESFLVVVHDIFNYENVTQTNVQVILLSSLDNSY